jgi:hypothetical protein
LSPKRATTGGPTSPLASTPSSRSANSFPPTRNLEIAAGQQSRAKSEWLHEFGWKVEHSLPTIFDSISEEMDEMKRLGQI